MMTTKGETSNDGRAAAPKVVKVPFTHWKATTSEAGDKIVRVDDNAGDPEVTPGRRFVAWDGGGGYSGANVSDAIRNLAGARGWGKVSALRKLPTDAAPAPPAAAPDDNAPGMDAARDRAAAADAEPEGDVAFLVLLAGGAERVVKTNPDPHGPGFVAWHEAFGLPGDTRRLAVLHLAHNRRWQVVAVLGPEDGGMNFRPDVRAADGSCDAHPAYWRGRESMQAEAREVHAALRREADDLKAALATARQGRDVNAKLRAVAEEEARALRRHRDELERRLAECAVQIDAAEKGGDL